MRSAEEIAGTFAGCAHFGEDVIGGPKQRGSEPAVAVLRLLSRPLASDWPVLYSHDQSGILLAKNGPEAPRNALSAQPPMTLDRDHRTGRGSTVVSSTSSGKSRVGPLRFS